MEVKTCEEYVLDRLYEAEVRVDTLMYQLKCLNDTLDKIENERDYYKMQYESLLNMENK